MVRLPGDKFIPNDPRFEALHPRDRAGPDRGEFVEKLDLPSLGGIWDANRGVWLVPKDQREQIDAWLAENGLEALVVPEGMRPLRVEDNGRVGNFKIPPSWTDVFVAIDPHKAPYIAMGRDSEGRVQRRRSLAQTTSADAAKFARVRALSERIEAIDDALSKNAGNDDTAAAMMLVRKMGLRTGGPGDSRHHQAFGAATLQRRHVAVTGKTVKLSFVGKEGKTLNLELEDAELARVLKPRLKDKVGTDALFPRTSRKLMNAWVKKHAGGDFTVKDFRTYLATSEALTKLGEFTPAATKKDQRVLELKVGSHVAGILGNTRMEALRSYIDPNVFTFRPIAGGSPALDDVPGTTGRNALRDAFENGHEIEEALQAGASAGSVERVLLSDGTRAVLKRPGDGGEVRHEVAAGVLANVLGFDDLHTIEVDGAALTTHVDGSVGALWRDRHIDTSPGALQEQMTLPGGREVAVLDFLTRNQDRNDLNWIVTADGVRPIDHGRTIWDDFDADVRTIHGPFGRFWFGPQGPQVSVAYLDRLEERLKAARVEFTDDEWAALMARLRLLRETAPSSIDGEVPFGELREQLLPA